MRRLVLLTALVALAAPAPAAAAGPSIVTEAGEARPGESVGVRLSGWPAGVVTVALCGNGAHDGSADCAMTTASSASVPASGSVQLTVRPSAPPVGCPCVLRAMTVTGDRSATTPIEVTGVADAATVATGNETARLSVTDARVRNEWGLSALLGGPARRVLEVTVRNDGTAPAPATDLALDLGRAAGRQALAPVPVVALAAADARTVEVPFTVSAPAIGRYTITGNVDGQVFTARTSCWPWLLPVLLAAFAVAVVTLRRVRLSPVRAGGIGLIGAGVVCAAVLVVQAVVPARETAAGQSALADRLAAGWASPGPTLDAGSVTGLDAPAAAPAEGQPFAVLHVPRWRTRYTIVEGVTTADLRKGPGHYPGTALPGQLGNVAIAGHRGPEGLPFNDIDELRENDPIVVETATAWYVYRVTGHLVVTPDRVDVVAPVPEQPGVTPHTAMLTMTACHPRFSSRQRYVVHARLAETGSKAEVTRPEVLQGGRAS
ncbi:class E sortase [Actinoplanes sp. RD1]|uniref:class E sortase n=1 Tax=Actinoplanes sp. RD1 TaxID=3064538 RepID=UPI0027407DCE|nr:class E sortase [Actinoplanes sp. RD1]